jgi:hypothetical protein
MRARSRDQSEHRHLRGWTPISTRLPLQRGDV